MAWALRMLRSQCDVLIVYTNSRSEECTRLEEPITRPVANDGGFDSTFTVLGLSELCTSATICTINEKSQQRSSKSEWSAEGYDFGLICDTAFVLRNPSRSHSSGDATLTQDPSKEDLHGSRAARNRRAVSAMPCIMCATWSPLPMLGSHLQISRKPSHVPC